MLKRFQTPNQFEVRICCDQTSKTREQKRTKSVMAPKWFQYFSKSYWEKRFENTTAMEYGLYSVKAITIALHPLGIRASTDCHVYWLSYVCAFFMTEHSLTSLYTVYYYWNINRISSIQPFTILAVSVPVSLFHRSFLCSVFFSFFLFLIGNEYHHLFESQHPIYH